MKQVSRFRRKSISARAMLGALLLLSLTAMLATAPAALSAPSRASYVVVLKDDVAHPAYLAHRHERNRGAEITHVYGVAIKGYSADLTPGELKAIKKDPNVDYVESDGVIEPKGQAVGNQLKRVYANLSNLKINESDVPADRVNADIAILDTGVYAHPDLNVVSRVDCTGGGGGGGCKPGQPNDDQAGHGTHVAGDAAAIDNGIGAVGTAPGARIWSVKVVSQMGHIGSDDVGMILSEPPNPAIDLNLGNAQMSDAIAGIDYVTAHSSEIEVANMSFACSTYEWGCARTALAQAIATSVNSGVVWVAAAGQEGDAVAGIEQVGIKVRHYPALLSDVITVSAMADYDGLPGSLSNSNGCSLEKGTQVDDRLMGPGKPSAGTEFTPDGSNFGPEVDITAPGSCVFSTWSPYVNSNSYDIPYGSTYGFMYGSSVASALVAGAAADIASQFNPNSRADVENIKAALVSAGNYSWEDLISAVPPAGPFYSPDGVKEPLLDMRYISPFPPPSPPPAPPAVATAEPNEISQTKAKLNGSVNPNGSPTTYYIEWGPTSYYGNTVSGSAGAGTTTVSVSKLAEGLFPGTTYHYRVRVVSAGGSALGADKQFTTPKQPTVFFSDAGRGGSMTRWTWENSVGWQQIPMNNDMIAPGTKPAPIMINGTPHVFFNDASIGNRMADWSRNGSTGEWELNPLYGPQMAPKSSPSAVVANGVAHVFFVEKSNTMGDWVLKNPTATWEPVTLYGDKVSFGSSPSAIANGLSAQAYFSDADKSDTIAVWTWSPSSLGQQFFHGDGLTPGSSPSAIMNGSNPQIYYSSAPKSNTIGVWTWTSTTLTPQFFHGDGLTPGSSPSAIMNGSNPQIYYSSAPKVNTIGVWTWTPSALTPQFFNGNGLAAGSSPSAIMNGSIPEIYFADASNKTSTTTSVWKWTPTTLTMTPLFGAQVSAGSSPVAMMLG